MEAPKPDGDALDAESAAARAMASDSARIVQNAMDRVRNPMTAIRARCIQCSNGQPKEVRHCPCTTCALHPFRMGENPYNKKVRERLAAEAGEDDSDDE